MMSTEDVSFEQSTNVEARQDHELMAEVVRRNDEAFEVLHRRHSGMVRRIAAGILRDDVEAEDVSQEIFLEVYLRAHLYDQARGTVRTWLMQYAYHRSLRRKSALRFRPAYRGVAISELGVQPSRPPVEIAQAERRWLIRSALVQLPPGQRATIELVCFEDLPLDDVAKRTGVSWGCARHRYYRGLASLRDCLERGAPASTRIRAGTLPESANRATAVSARGLPRRPRQKPSRGGTVRSFRGDQGNSPTTLRHYTLKEEIEFLEEYRDRVINVMEKPLTRRLRQVSRKQALEAFLETKDVTATAVTLGTSYGTIYQIVGRAFRVARILAGVWPPPGYEDLNDHRDRILAMEDHDEDD